MANHVTGVVLLCAEDDDLELVSWVHNARKHGITPEVVIGVERDDEPLIEALANAGPTLFVVLRSDNLDLRRMTELKSVFARHRKPGQELLALRLQPEEAEDAIVKIAAKIGRDVRPRTGPFPAVPLSERSGATPRPILIEDVTPIGAGTEPTGVFAVVPAETVDAAPTEAPPVAEALDWARRATELEITEPVSRIEAPPAFRSSATDRAGIGKRARGTTGVAMLATATAIVMLFAVVGGILWLSAAEWTSAVDGGQRSSVVAPTSGKGTNLDAAPSEARIPAMERGDGAGPVRKPRTRARRHAGDEDLAPLETIEAPTRDAAPALLPSAPVGEVGPVPEAPSEPPSETATASADRQPVAADEASVPAAAGAVTRPPA